MKTENFVRDLMMRFICKDSELMDNFGQQKHKLD